MRSSPPQFDRAKLKEAVWFLASYCPAEELGNVKLHKMLYFADMFSFVMEGRPITGEEYLKQKFGPTARHLTSIVRALEEEGAIKVEDRPFFGFTKKAYVSIRPFEPVKLSERERGLLGEVADFVRGHSARSVSELSHDAVWQAAAMGETLPYFTALRLSPEEATEDDLTWASAAARDHASPAYR